ncbi:hypothetical protein BDB01DRAFT_799610 [Pilobolus umbonatus]|nr:hypothetical protein BDB01DRAFT_799610 [Pilobolus umbonatus]
MRTALILGATGAVGKQLLKDILVNGSYDRVITAGRRICELDSSIPQDKLVQKVVDFEHLEVSRDVFRSVDDVFCTLGISMNDAGSNENFVKIDQQYVLNAAKVIIEENKPSVIESALSPVHFLYVSSVFANANSQFLYLKSKGQTEEALKKAGFERVSIFRPGGLKIVEPRRIRRQWNEIFLMFMSPLDRLFNLHMTVSVATVGIVMHRIARDTSLRPISPDGVTTSAVGSMVSLFLTKDLDMIGSPK